MKRFLRDLRMDEVVIRGQSHTGDEQGESDWYFRCEIITKSELGLQGTQMADLNTGMLLCLGQVAGELTGVYVAGSRVV